VKGIVNPMQSGAYNGFRIDVFFKETADILESMIWDKTKTIPTGIFYAMIIQLFKERYKLSIRMELTIDTTIQHMIFILLSQTQLKKMDI